MLYLGVSQIQSSHKIEMLVFDHVYWPLGLHLSVMGKDLPNTACLRDGTIHCMARHGDFKNLIACQPSSILYTPH